MDDPVPEFGEPLRRIVLDVFERNRSELEATVSWVSFADPHGTINIEWSTTKTIATTIRAIALGQGAMLSTDDAGSNGIGRALTSKSTSLVSGREHDDERFHELVCAAAPVLHPITGGICGIVNVTGHLSSPHSHVSIALTLIMSHIRSELSRRMAPKPLRLADAHRRVMRHFPNAVATFDEHTLIAESGIAPQLAATDRHELWEVCSKLSLGTTEITLPSGPKVRVIPVTKGTWTDGASVVFDVLRAESAPHELITDPRGKSLTPLEAAERNVIATVLSRCNGNKSDAADQLGLSRGTLYARVRRYGL